MSRPGSFTRENPRPGPGRPRREYVLCELAKAERQRVIDVHKEVMNNEKAPALARLAAAQQLGEWADGKTSARPWMLEDPIVADFTTEAGCIAAIRETVGRVFAGKLPPEQAHLMIRMAGALIVAEHGVMEGKIRAMFEELQQALDVVQQQKAVAPPVEPKSKNGKGNGHG